MCLTLLLGSCQSYVKASVDCPTPPGILLQRERSLAEINPLKLPLSERQALELWAKDIDAYERLRDRHTRLQNWMQTWCLSGRNH